MAIKMLRAGWQKTMRARTPRQITQQMTLAHREGPQIWRHLQDSRGGEEEGGEGGREGGGGTCRMDSMRIASVLWEEEGTDLGLGHSVLCPPS
jgi:hypothetical protein